MYSTKLVNVAISRDNREKLRELGRTAESFNDIISSLLKEKQSKIEAIREAKNK